MRIIITLNRAHRHHDPTPGDGTHDAPAARQDYLIHVTTFDGQGSPHLGRARTVWIDWRAMDADLAELSAAARAPALQQRIGDQLRALLREVGWVQHERRILDALAAGRRVHVTVMSNAAEVYRLPWELLTFADQGASLLAHELAVISYTLPREQLADGLREQQPNGLPGSLPAGERQPLSVRPTRALFVWSDAGQAVPHSQHLKALHAAFGADAVTEVKKVTLGGLRAALQAIEPDVTLALHILCHGAEHDRGHSLTWHAPVGGQGLVSAADLRDALAPHASKLAVATLCACDSAGAGELGRTLGPVAQEAHRLGIPWVIGARYPFTFRGSIAFTRAFYGALLGESVSLERAYARGRLASFDDTERRDHIGLQLYARDEHRGREPAREMASEPVKLWRVPGLPLYHLDRPDEMQRVVAALCGQGDRPVSIGAVAHGLHGMGGIGKTVLATAVARSQAIAERFADGVYWLTVGQEPQLTTLQSQFARALGIADTAFDSPIDGKQKLTAALAGKRALLVLDDVWDATHAEALEVVGEAGRILITTRNLDVLTWRGAEPLALDIMTTEQACALLATWTGVPAESLPASASDVAEACGRLPLALAIAGSLVGKPGGSWARVLRLLRSAKLDKLRGQMPAYPYRNVYQAIAASVSQLVVDGIAEGAEQCYADLAVFAEDEDIPAAALRVLWGRHGLDADDVDDLACALASYSLAGMSENARLRLHDIQRGYAHTCHGDVAALHGTFVDAYAATCQDGDLARGPAKASFDYFYARLPYHLVQAGRASDLRRLLGRYAWLERKLRTRGAVELIADYDLLTDLDSQSRGLLLIRDALRLSSHVLADDPSQLPGQLIGRLGGLRDTFDVIDSLLAQARAEPTEPWMCPVMATLTPPGGPLLRTFEGHSDWVLAVALSADGQIALSGSLDRTIKLWKTETGALLRTFEGHSDYVQAVALSMNGQFALSGSRDATLKLWDIKSGTLLRTFEGHSDGVKAVALSMDNQLALSASSDGTLMLWDIKSGVLLWTLQGHRHSVNAVALSAGGHRVLSGSSDKTLKLWDTESGALLHTFEGHSGSVNAVVLSVDGQLALSGSSDKTLKLWDMESGFSLRTFKGHSDSVFAMQNVDGHRDGVNAVALSADGQFVLSGSSDQTLKLWDTESGVPLRTFKGHSSGVSAVALSMDGQHVLSGSLDKTLKLWDTESESFLHISEGHSVGVGAVALSVDGQFALSGADDQALKLWDTESGALLHTFRGPYLGRVKAVALRMDGQGTLFDKTLKLWDTVSKSLLHIFPSHLERIKALALSDASMPGDTDRRLKLWDIKSGTLLHTFQSHGTWSNVALSLDGQLALSISSDTLQLWETEGGALLHTFQDHSNLYSAVALSADGQRVLFASRDKTLKLWDTGSGALIRSFSGHPDPVVAVASNTDKLFSRYERYLRHSRLKSEALALSADGQFALTGSHGDALKLWDTKTGTLLRTLTGHSDSVSEVALNADGQLALSGSHDKTLKLWDTGTGRMVAAFSAEAPILACALSMSIPTVVVAGDGTGRVHFLQLITPTQPESI